jgi:hypothetical protein
MVSNGMNLKPGSKMRLAVVAATRRKEAAAGTIPKRMRMRLQHADLRLERGKARAVSDR